MSGSTIIEAAVGAARAAGYRRGPVAPLILVLFALGCCGDSGGPPRFSMEVLAWWSGASPDDVEAAVARPLEQALLATSDLVRAETTVRGDEVRVTLWFEGEEIHVRMAEVFQLVQGARADLPDGVIPMVSESALVEGIAVVALSGPSGDAVDAEVVRSLVDDIERIPGVGHCAVLGVRREQIVVTVDPLRALAHGLGPADIGGRLDLEGMVVTPAALQEIETQPLRRVGEGLLLLRDVSRIERRFADDGVRASLSGVPVSILVPVLEAGEDRRRARKDLGEVLEQARQRWPEGIHHALLEPAGGDLRASTRSPDADEAWRALEPLGALAGEAGVHRHLALVGGRTAGLAAPDPGWVELSWWLEGGTAADARSRLEDGLRCEPALASSQVVAAGDEELVVSVEGEDRAALADVAREVSEAVTGLRGVTGTWFDDVPGQPSVELEIDHEQADRLGISATEIAHAVRVVQGDTFLAQPLGGEPVEIVLRWGESAELEALERVPLFPGGEDGAVVPLSAVADLVNKTEDAVRYRVDGVPAVIVRIGVERRRARAVRRAIPEVLPEYLPAGVTVELEP